MKIPTSHAFRLSDGTTLEPFIAKILEHRGIAGEENIQNFLEPKLKDLPDPFLMKDMDKAVEVIGKALTEKQEIVVWGDYDVDGTSATALLLLFFQQLGHKTRYYIPNRLTEGYGLNREGLLELVKGKEKKERVLITVDNGIAAYEELKFAKSLGFTNIVTDHHLPMEEKVPAHAILNPHQQDCNFPDKNLSGVGVAFYLAIGLRSHLVKNEFFSNPVNIPNMKPFLGLVAVGTIADMVPITKTNRILVKAGMEMIAAGSNLGITALCNQCNVDKRHIRSEDVSFQLGPKINSAGRLGNADKAVELFLSENQHEAEKLAKILVQSNELRRNKTLSDSEDAESLILKSNQEQGASLVVAGSFHIGVAGIVAANFAEKHNKPTVILCEHEGGLLKGSARSVPGVDLHEALKECSEVLIAFGGHPMAGGMTLMIENLSKFKQLFEKAVNKQSQGKIQQQSDEADVNMGILELFSGKALSQLHLLEPFGVGNPPLNIKDPDGDIHQISALGKDKKHVRFMFGKGKSKIKGVGFGLGDKINTYREKGSKEIFYTPIVNRYKGQRNWEVRVSSIKVTKA